MIQIDMPMPESCAECRFSQGGYMYCHAMPENFCGYVNYCEENGRPEWCPLRTQEPRVMTWDELIATDHVYIETNNDWQRYVVPGIVTIVRDTAVIASVRIGTRLIDGTIDKDVYGIECRCWTSCPTDEQMGAVKWDG